MSAVARRSETIGKLPPDGTGMIPVPSEDLPIGERLSYPLYDHRGILLLSAGSQVTPRFLEKLRKQHICTVHVPEQVAQAELREEQECAEMCARLFDVHTETTWQLDQMIDDSSCLDFPST